MSLESHSGIASALLVDSNGRQPPNLFELVWSTVLSLIQAQAEILFSRLLSSKFQVLACCAKPLGWGPGAGVDPPRADPTVASAETMQGTV